MISHHSLTAVKYLLLLSFQSHLFHIAALLLPSINFDMTIGRKCAAKNITKSTIKLCSPLFHDHFGNSQYKESNQFFVHHFQTYGVLSLIDLSECFYDESNFSFGMALSSNAPIVTELESSVLHLVYSHFWIGDYHQLMIRKSALQRLPCMM